MKRLEIKKNIQKPEDQNLSFRAFDLSLSSLENYLLPHKKDHFCILMLESGEIEIQIEDQKFKLSSGKISIIFPEQISSVTSTSSDVSGKIILFEEVLFCSDILKNELLSYNIDLATHLNCVFLSPSEFEQSKKLAIDIENVYLNPSLVRKEQARFYIKIFLLGLIELVHGQHPVLQHETDKTLYIRFKKMLNERYKNERTVQYYASKLAITTKKLNNITKKHCDETAINAIHNRILQEIKRLLLFSDLSHKQISMELGFSSPSALNKFVKTKLKETPTELQEELAQIYNR
ncbi:helix-turn-helix domain-containing protein [Chryseobacterium viscerum]|uniref:AraC family transcriptional regulator n=1 Tax=Chryseobacterium viscerum TaxID=1037377 RepID=A0A316WDG6_9FLAO|nr:helix-turn-helix domain-containing protein [Chryseobacterium viscerum]PWN58363.1 AraC family transcriptional regulator [Chryseobacterium viscerum]